MLLATLFLASAGTSLYAQPPGGGQMSPEQRNAMMKEIASLLNYLNLKARQTLEMPSAILKYKISDNHLKPLPHNYKNIKAIS